MKAIDRKICPRCGEKCKLAPVSSFDPGFKLGGVWQCPSCGWDDWGHFVKVG